MAPASLAEIPDGAAVFIDANIFIYHFSGPSPLSPEHVKSLQAHHRAPERIHRMGVEVVSVGFEEIERSQQAKARYGLLTNDALLVTTMQRDGLTALASNDPDFDRVEGITLYRPSPSG